MRKVPKVSLPHIVGEFEMRDAALDEFARGGFLRIKPMQIQVVSKATPISTHKF